MKQFERAATKLLFTFKSGETKCNLPFNALRKFLFQQLDFL